MTPERTWRKSSYSGDTASGSCVEVSLSTAAPTPRTAALVRDSKATGGDALVFSIQAWRAFVASVA